MPYQMSLSFLVDYLLHKPSLKVAKSSTFSGLFIHAKNSLTCVRKLLMPFKLSQGINKEIHKKLLTKLMLFLIV